MSGDDADDAATDAATPPRPGAGTAGARTTAAAGGVSIFLLYCVRVSSSAFPVGRKISSEAFVHDSCNLQQGTGHSFLVSLLSARGKCGLA